ncbi:hypothetical protein BP6252_01885 [Coleophoma cylindrospora]|uniref:Uncharacterized protein n=1 Tax=Coleophoma cylindrospora TaxID=1849047 RepID=A0A3D8SD67_9HELO|nr:hypothetical protein BP6252_01885 [Coleophoma cylindrospora]
MDTDMDGNVGSLGLVEGSEKDELGRLVALDELDIDVLDDDRVEEETLDDLDVDVLVDDLVETVDVIEDEVDDCWFWKASSASRSWPANASIWGGMFVRPTTEGQRPQSWVTLSAVARSKRLAS